ncbi:exodeoxyribonuclease VII small subunit [Paraperlucidibaca wandonensis]|jgi:exodeoxyribonuclease VII small subunit|uniref:Exodeoxyribonuclease 7 small subunit n=1 Tax=Paraperlucidibaca wandonensis TaxID=1268273 RepID=A0ABW3HG52_9GAMM|nr:exodeoxyribonuclease VII small subunit [Paraperlucidibaca sp.]MBQ0723262.1 exodeoxyribonuclease VII small subunit [Paraperlucidibaca sp.]MBQ0842345.1 exodeoxyribonuclease VII small subunit [Paraperlucidibaca sp.]|tara:strand:+ start:4111 stop:4362 length:252 start_codon:yes stop_codon:yes gene_type:complete
MTDATQAKPVDFERALAELESQVQRLEGGDLPLEDALKAFEEGVRLTRQCQQSLDAAEQKVQLLLAKRDGSLDTEAFTPRDDS